MIIEYRHSATPDKMSTYDTHKAYKNAPKLFNPHETIADFTRHTLLKFNKDLQSGVVLAIRHSALRDPEIVVKNTTGTCDAVEVLKQQGYEDLTPAIPTFVNRFFCKDGKFYKPVGWNREDPVFNGSVIIREIWD